MTANDRKAPCIGNSVVTRTVADNEPKGVCWAVASCFFCGGIVSKDGKSPGRDNEINDDRVCPLQGSNSVA
jgi:hypothetical protein